MKIKFLGGAEEVGRLAMLCIDGANRFLFDYGFVPSKPPLYPEFSPVVDAAFISHSHVDHSGMVPMLADFPGTHIFATSATISTSHLLLEDSIKVGTLEGTPPPYGKEDVINVMKKVRAVSFGDIDDFNGTELAYHSAGHIPGAAMFEMNSHKTTLFTGDFSTLDTELVCGAKPVKCDNLIIEGTYSGRDHPDRKKTVYNFIRKIEDMLDRGGIAVVPAFAVSRTQELLLALASSKFEVWLDGMGKKVNGIYSGESQYLRYPKRFRKAIRMANVVRNQHDRGRALGGDVIVTTSGMLDGGPVGKYMSELYDNPKNAILLTGFQVPGSNGRKLLDTGTLELYGADVRVDCEVCQFDFSAHAGHSDIIRFIRDCKPQKVVFMHSDDPSALAGEIGNEYEVIIPKNGVEFEL